jgi:16S rRNA (uracil1498-N3)-methyltransferase
MRLACITPASRVSGQIQKALSIMAVHDFRSQRLFIDMPLDVDATHSCTKEQSNYLRNVLRLNEGDEILVFNGRDGEWRARYAQRGKRDCDLALIEQFREQTSGSDIDYLFAPLKRARLDYMVQKATEMGVASLQPVMTARTVAGRVNTARMRANVIEAAEQCGILRIPVVHEPARLDAILSDWPAGRTLVFADEAASITSSLAPFDGIPRGAPISVLIGPEGGFSDDERGLIRSMPDACTISLGPRIMRADTAAVALLALVNATVGDWSA